MKTTRLMPRVWTLGAFVGLGSVVLGCTADFPAGVITCGESSDCPKGQSCRFEAEASEGLCFPGAVNGVTTQPSSPEASTSDSTDGAAVDASPYDDPQPDAGRADDGGRPGTQVGQPHAGTKGSAGRGGTAGSSAGRSGTASGSAGRASTGGNRAGAGATAGSTHTETPEAGGGGQAGRPVTTPCDNPARECSAGEVDMDRVACGTCGTGTVMTLRTCSNACAWSEPVPMGACADPAECTPNATGSQMVACPGCGAKTQTHVCSPTTCTFEPWVDASECSWCADCGELVFCDTPDSVAPDRGTWCRPQNGCSNQQAWGRCMELRVDKGCELHEPYYIGN
jgi:hypothetical protein